MARFNVAEHDDPAPHAAEELRRRLDQSAEIANRACTHCDEGAAVLNFVLPIAAGAVRLPHTFVDVDAVRRIGQHMVNRHKRRHDLQAIPVVYRHA
jgi:aspartate aminotransferase-like enzyme